MRNGSWAMGFSMASRTAWRMSGTGAIGGLASITLVRSGSRTVRLLSPYAMRSVRVSAMSGVDLRRSVYPMQLNGWSLVEAALRAWDRR